MTHTEITSPCIRRCCLDGNDICVGCFRTLEEIKKWSNASDSEKSIMLANALQRKPSN